jgi:carnitine-CoA ligase
MEVDVQSMLPLLRERAAETPDRVVLNEIGGRTLSYGAFYQEALLWADALERLGVQRGEAVATMLPTGADAFVFQVACSCLGAISVPVNSLMRGNPLSHVLNASHATTLVTRDGYFVSNRELLSTAAGLRRVIVIDAEPATHWSNPSPHFKVVAPGDALADAQAVPRPDPVPASTQSLIFTSGTSGPPKPVDVSHKALTNYAAQIVSDPDHAWPHDSGYYSPWSTSHGLGFLALAIAVQRGQRLVVRDGFSIDSYWSDISRYGCHLTVAVNIAQALWNRAPLADDGDNPLHTMIMVPVIPEFRAFSDRFSVRITSLYGMTEIGPALTSTRPTTHRAAGHANRGYVVQLVDPCSRVVDPGEVGELIVRHIDGAIASRYAHLPVATATAWRDGWFHTGDRFVEKAGELLYVDRLTDSIRHRGRNISAWQIEEEARSHPAVAECVCVGFKCDASSMYGESDHDLRLFLVLTQDSAFTVEQLTDYLRPRLPPYMVPRYYDVLDEMPTSVTGRIIKAELQARPLTADTIERVSTARRDPGRALPATGR